MLYGELTMLPLEKVQKVNRPRRMCAAVCVSPFVCRPASGGTGFFFPRAALPALCENNENKKSAKDLAMHRHRHGHVHGEWCGGKRETKPNIRSSFF